MKIRLQSRLAKILDIPNTLDLQVLKNCIVGLI